MKTETLYAISEDLAALEELLIETGGEVSAGVAEAAIDSWFEELGARRDAKVDSYCALIRNLEARAASRKAEAARLSDRARIDTSAIERLKGRLLAFFDAHAIKTLETDRFRVTAAANGGVAPLVINWEPERLPEALQVHRIEANKAVIREMLESGLELDFAQLGERGAIHSDQVMRTYGTPGDFSAEAAVAAIIEQEWGCCAKQLPRFYVVDRALMEYSDAPINCLLEVKRRYVAMDKYPTFMISASKLFRMKELAKEMRVPGYIAVQWNDVLACIEINDVFKLNPDLQFYMGGRNDRGDPEDNEPVAYIPIEQFSPLRGMRPRFPVIAQMGVFE